MITLECPECETSSRSVLADVVATFRSGVVGTVQHGQVELGILTRVVANGLVISLDQLQCPACKAVSQMKHWQIHVGCECGKRIVTLLETMQDPMLESTYCRHYNYYLCKLCWGSANCSRCEHRDTCKLEEYYDQEE